MLTTEFMILGAALKRRVGPLQKVKNLANILDRIRSVQIGNAY